VKKNVSSTLDQVIKKGYNKGCSGEESRERVGTAFPHLFHVLL